MTLATRLVTAALTSNKFLDRNIYTTLFDHEFKVINMIATSLRQLLIKNLQQQPSGSEALLATYLDLVDANSSQTTHMHFRNTIMEPYLKACDASNDLQLCNKSTVCEESTTNVLAKLDLKSDEQAEKYSINKPTTSWKKSKATRKWMKLHRGNQSVNLKDSFIFRIFSYNILAQYLLETHNYLYQDHDKRALLWETRKKLLTQEIVDSQASVICLQEMQMEHLSDFIKPFQENGYNYLYKKGTNEKSDGIVLLYRSDIFNLVDHAKVEYFQSGIELLSRNNVGLIAKLSLKNSPATQVVIATTHLLFNPRRNDVRLGQVQILMAELERMAFIENTSSGPRYLPMVITGDFNLGPHTGVYEFITRGIYEYAGKSRTLEQAEYHRLTNSLIPPHLYVTDSCHHYHVLVKRLRNEGHGQVQLEHSERVVTKSTSPDSGPNQYKKTEVDVKTNNCQQIKITNNHWTTFGSGYLMHPFALRSLYSHTNDYGEPEATTYQDRWITVDYIFYSEVEPIEKYSLPTVSQCKKLQTIPNSTLGSDHLSLGATFKLKLKKSS